MCVCVCVCARACVCVSMLRDSACNAGDLGSIPGLHLCGSKELDTTEQLNTHTHRKDISRYQGLFVV